MRVGWLVDNDPYLQVKRVVLRDGQLGLRAQRHLPDVLGEIAHHALPIPLRGIKVKNKVDQVSDHPRENRSSDNLRRYRYGQLFHGEASGEGRENRQQARGEGWSSF